MLRETLLQVERGMIVRDRYKEAIGEVSNIFYSDEDPDNPGPETVTGSDTPEPTVPNWVNEFVQAFDIDNDIPAPIKKRLHREGFIRVKKEFYLGDKDYFIPLSQINNVVDNTVFLNIAKEDAMNLG